MICLDKEFIFQVVSRQVIVTFADPVVQDLQVRLETSEEALFQSVQSLISKSLKIVKQELIRLNLQV